MDSFATSAVLAQGPLGQTAGNVAVVWIVVAVVVVLLLVALVVGLLAARRRRVNLRADRPEPAPGRPEGYQNTGGISFSAGTGTLDRPAAPPVPAAAPPAPDAAAPVPAAAPAPEAAPDRPAEREEQRP
ncbi:MAG TPA: hypothetical protein VNP03_23495, partial [Pseudonocardia sp.]|nr:hypothetical protein [Pseudonocardia sp.]